MVRTIGITFGIFTAAVAKTCPTTLFDETKVQRGEGTFYDDASIGTHPNNGNCGFCKLPKVLNDRWRVALSYADYGPNRPQYGPHGRGGSAACGMCIKFRFPDSTVDELPNKWSDAFVVDSCTGCKQGDVDFGVKGVSPPYDGRQPVEWYAEPCPGDSKISYDFSSVSGASTNFYLRMGVRGMKVPLEQVEMCESGANNNECKPFNEETDGKWVLNFNELGKAFKGDSMKVRLTSIYGEQLDDVVGPITRQGANIGHNCAALTSTEEPIEGKVQFKNTKGPGVLTNPGSAENGNGIHGCGTVPPGGPHPGDSGTPPVAPPTNPDGTPPVAPPTNPDGTPPVAPPTNPDGSPGSTTPTAPTAANGGNSEVLIIALCCGALLCCCLVCACYRQKLSNGSSSAVNEQRTHAVSGARSTSTRYSSGSQRHSSRRKTKLHKPHKKTSKRSKRV